VVHDAIRGDATFRHVHLDDPVIARADGSVLYNFAVAVDDADAGITHVVRGEDHLSNTPKQLLVLEAIGAPIPVYGHLPLLHGPDGKKLSKRHGAASVQELRAAGYLPEAVVNYVALLGAGFDPEREIFSRGELAELFTLSRVARNPAVFDERKLRHLNGHYLRELGVDDLTARLEEREGRTGLRDAVAIAQEKIQTLADFWPLAGFLFDGPADDPAARERVLGTPESRARLTAAGDALEHVDPWDEAGVEAALRGIVQREGVKPREVFQPVRVAIAGSTVSPGIFESVALLGRAEVSRRIRHTLAE
jgi:glutamyl-tRNA synthetase